MAPELFNILLLYPQNIDIYANTVYFQNPPYLFTLEPKLSRYIIVGDFH
jgi:hypothetical protein